MLKGQNISSFLISTSNWIIYIEKECVLFYVIVVAVCVASNYVFYALYSNYVTILNSSFWVMLRQMMSVSFSKSSVFSFCVCEWRCSSHFTWKSPNISISPLLVTVYFAVLLHWSDIRFAVYRLQGSAWMQLIVQIAAPLRRHALCDAQVVLRL